MSVNSIIQLIEIDLTRDINVTELASEAENKTTSLLEAINFISLKIMEMSEGSKESNDKINSLSGVIAELADLAMVTNKISNESHYHSGMRESKGLIYQQTTQSTKQRKSSLIFSKMASMINRLAKVFFVL